MNALIIITVLARIVQERGPGDPIVSVERWLQVREFCTVKVTLVNEMETEISMLVCVNTNTMAIDYVTYLERDAS